MHLLTDQTECGTVATRRELGVEQRVKHKLRNVVTGAGLGGVRGLFTSVVKIFDYYSFLSTTDTPVDPEVYRDVRVCSTITPMSGQGTDTRRRHAHSTKVQLLVRRQRNAYVCITVMGGLPSLFNNRSPFLSYPFVAYSRGSGSSARSRCQRRLSIE